MFSTANSLFNIADMARNHLGGGLNPNRTTGVSNALAFVQIDAN